MGVNKIICFQPPCGAFILICIKPGRTMSTVWTPGRSPLNPCQSLNHLTSNHCSDSGVARYHVSFAFNLATAVSSATSAPLPLSRLPWIDIEDFFFEVCVSPTIIKAKGYSSFPSIHSPQHSYSLCLSFFIPSRRLLILKTCTRYLLLAKSWQLKSES